MSRYQFPDHRIRLDYVMDTMNTRLAFKDKPRVLDLGCGYDTVIQDMEFKEYVGVDIDIVHEGKVFKGIHFVKANYEEPLPLPENRYDIVLWLEGPEHTLKHKEVLQNIHRCIHPLGFLIITCPNEGKWSVLPEGGGHKCTFGLDDLSFLVECQGFTILEAAKVYSRIPLEKKGYDWLFLLATPAHYDPRYVK